GLEVISDGARCHGRAKAAGVNGIVVSLAESFAEPPAEDVLVAKAGVITGRGIPIFVDIFQFAIGPPHVIIEICNVKSLFIAMNKAVRKSRALIQSAARVYAGVALAVRTWLVALLRWRQNAQKGGWQKKRLQNNFQ